MSNNNHELNFRQYWDLANLTETEYLNRIGPKYLPMKIKIPLAIVYVTIFVIGIFGNIATCTVIISNVSMQTTTNYYLFNLAISDLILLMLGLSTKLNIFWRQYSWLLGTDLCKIKEYVLETSSYVSALTIMAFSMERYLAICHPLRVYSMRKRCIHLIFEIWLFALVAAIPFAIYTEVNLVEYPPGPNNYSTESGICAMLLHNIPNFPLYELSCIVFFFIPMLVIAVLYTRMGLKIWNNKHTLGSVPGSVHGDYRRMQSRKSVIRMLGAVVIFFICWAPFHVQRLLYIYGQRSDYSNLKKWFYILSDCMHYFSTTANLLLYNIMSTKYRQAFKQMIFCCMRRTIE